jgi:hypothetical protein
MQRAHGGHHADAARLQRGNGLAKFGNGLDDLDH